MQYLGSIPSSGFSLNTSVLPSYSPPGYTLNPDVVPASSGYVPGVSSVKAAWVPGAIDLVGTLGKAWLDLETAKVNARSQAELNSISRQQASIAAQMQGQKATTVTRNTIIAAAGIGVAALVGFMALR